MKNEKSNVAIFGKYLIPSGDIQYYIFDCNNDKLYITEGMVSENKVPVFHTLNILNKELMAVKTGFKNCGEFNKVSLKEVEKEYKNYKLKGLKILKKISI